jgi:RNA polymerase sigma-70 factor (ECF subfamily)
MSQIADRSDTYESDGAAAPTVESFESFYLREYRSVLALAVVLTGNRSTAEDLAQDAFMAAFRSWSDIGNASAWIRSVVSNKAMTWWRRSHAANRAMARLAQIEVGEPDLPEDTAHFWREVRRLPRRQAQSIALFYLEDRPVKDIAEMLGCDASTVRIHLTRGRRKLAERLEVAT